ncbi:MAG: hypothetical protein A2286_14155 [Gammaproteobacteria bacterium RIFOXYA12_FULL_61_12]|nr:MAG: hypothetical protein A2514_07815 [Gammaproteobacteria bacterium RIFOXYD12_FULL_61_37]OGT89617.1 MAG: hypothetical protein A2286_14155 [Gammaproteobacteria bacterium RIFOXYA12_FULL_61_12]
MQAPLEPRLAWFLQGDVMPKESHILDRGQRHARAPGDGTGQLGTESPSLLIIIARETPP